MSKEQIAEFELALFEFVKRASGIDATPAEVESLPSVASVLMNLIRR